jgi:hypothetical protein
VTTAIDEKLPQSDVNVAEFARVVETLEERWRVAGDESYDPYDGLLYSRLPGRLRANRWSRLGLVQWHKRLPFNTRALFGIHPTRNAYAVGQLASAAIHMAAAGRATTTLRASIDERLEWLRATRVDGGWTYPFEVQTKTNHYAASLPNVISTVFAGRAFLDAFSLLHDDSALPVAADAAAFMRRELWSARGSYFGYHAGEPSLIHNANVVAADFVVHVGSLTGDDAIVEQGMAAVETSLEFLRADGSLLYGDGPALSWIDGHHTGFVIESLRRIEDAVPGAGLGDRLRAMTDFYRARLFAADGCPFQRPDRRYPIDAIAGAQGIKTFAVLGGAHCDFAVTIARFMLDNMRRRDGGFLYHRGRVHKKRVAYLRWSDAPIADALATLVHTCGDGR